MHAWYHALLGRHPVATDSQETGRGYDTFNISDFDLYDTYLPPFESAFKKGKSSGLMCSCKAGRVIGVWQQDIAKGHRERERCDGARVRPNPSLPLPLPLGHCWEGQTRTQICRGTAAEGRRSRSTPARGMCIPAPFRYARAAAGLCKNVKRGGSPPVWRW